jgi:hypothetical protein
MPIEEDASQLNAGLPIRVDEVYTLTDFKKRTGLGKAGVRAARRRGLPVHQCGRNRYVSGADWAEFLRARTVSKQIDETA